MPLDLKFGGAEIRGSKFAAARNWKSAARFKAWEQLERASTRSLPVDLKFGDAFEVGGSKFAGVWLLGFEVRSIQSLGAAEEGVDAKFEVKRVEIQHRRIP